MINNISNELTGTKINRRSGTFTTVSNLDDLKYGSSTAFGFQISANYHIQIDQFNIVPSLVYQYEFKTGIGADSALEIGNIHYIAELKIGYTIQSTSNEK